MGWKKKKRLNCLYEPALPFTFLKIALPSCSWLSTHVNQRTPHQPNTNPQPHIFTRVMWTDIQSEKKRALESCQLPVNRNKWDHICSLLPIPSTPAANYTHIHKHYRGFISSYCEFSWNAEFSYKIFT